MPIIASAAISITNNKKTNLMKFLEYIEKAAKQKADLIVFPEYALQGLPIQGFTDLGVVSMDLKAVDFQYQNAELVPSGESTQYLISKAKEYNMYICWGMTEKDPDRCDVLYNSAVLVGPEGYVGTYRKVHLPLTDKLIYFPGNEYKVFDTRIGKIGIIICYDMSIPEAARILALKGAEIILCPTAWPAFEQSEDDDQFKLYNIFSFARASENMVFFVDSTVAGEYFAGHSRIIGPFPQDIRATTGFEEGLAIADIDVQGEILRGRLNAMGGANLLKDRRPDTYREIVNSCQIVGKYPPE